MPIRAVLVFLFTAENRKGGDPRSGSATIRGIVAAPECVSGRDNAPSDSPQEHQKPAMPIRTAPVFLLQRRIKYGNTILF